MRRAVGLNFLLQVHQFDDFCTVEVLILVIEALDLLVILIDILLYFGFHFLVLLDALPILSLIGINERHDFLHFLGFWVFTVLFLIIGTARLVGERIFEVLTEGNFVDSVSLISSLLFPALLFKLNIIQSERMRDRSFYWSNWLNGLWIFLGDFRNRLQWITSFWLMAVIVVQLSFDNGQKSFVEFEKCLNLVFMLLVHFFELSNFLHEPFSRFSELLVFSPDLFLFHTGTSAKTMQ